MLSTVRREGYRKRGRKGGRQRAREGGGNNDDYISSLEENGRPSQQLLSSCLFLVSSLLFLFGSVRQIKLAIRQLLGSRKYSPSFRVVSYKLKRIYASKIAEI